MSDSTRDYLEWLDLFLEDLVYSGEPELIALYLRRQAYLFAGDDAQASALQNDIDLQVKVLAAVRRERELMMAFRAELAANYDQYAVELDRLLGVDA